MLKNLLNLHVTQNQTLGQLLTVGFLTNILGSVLAAAAILLIGLIAANWFHKRIVGLTKRYHRLDQTLFTFLGNITRYVVLTFAGVFVLNKFGIQTTSIVAVLGAAGLAVGLALQGTLANVAAGVMIILFRPFKLGDFIAVDGVSGSVMDINLNFIELKTYDGLQIIVPNAKVWGNVMTNYSVYKTRMAEWTFGVGYATDLSLAERVIRETITSDPRALADPPFFLKVNSLNNSSVDFLCRCWANSADFWVFKNDMNRAVKEALDASGIEIPFPNRTVWLNHVTDQPKAPERETSQDLAAPKADQLTAQR
ncbi:mechanosensitive ion channel family protein [Solirhodobacter olei]|uniref:mechanosensitive ion channel family protein n=1 Tax=Solirhodobacter olei TaxID=2493082 RepID=UPI000FD76A24|nr:mechanosensitive ion channel family protein [Solirhodobacter olei]